MKLLIIFLGLVNIVVGLMNIASSYIEIDVLQFAIGLSLVILGFWAVSNQADGFSWSKIASKWAYKYISKNERIWIDDQIVKQVLKSKMTQQQYNKELDILIHEELPKVTNIDIALGTHSESDSADYYHEILSDIKEQKKYEKSLRNTKDIGREDN